MKRLVFLLLFFFLLSFKSFTKSIEIVNCDYEVFTSPNSDDVKAYCVFKNISDKEINVKLSVKLVEATEGFDVSFCWGKLCFPPMSVNEIWEPSESLILQPGETTGQNDFYLTFLPNGLVGSAIVEATLYNKDIPEDSIQLNFRLISSVSTVSELVEKDIPLISSAEFVNLASLGYSPGVASLYSLNAILVNQIAFSDKIDISTLPNGIYLVVQNRPKLRIILLNKF